MHLELGKEAPIEYIEYKYREKFLLSKTEYDKQPISVVLNDLKIMQVEGEYTKNNGK